MPRTPDDPTKAQAWLTQNGPEIGLELYVPRGNKGDPGGFTAGTVLGTANLNEIVTPGLYKQDNSVNATALRNYPRDGVSGSMKVYDRVAPGAFGSVFQEWTPAVSSTAGAPLLYIRYSYNGHASWSPWRVFASQRVDQTAGRAIYTWDEANSREQLVYGDTGWRDVKADLLNGATANSFNIRRIGYQVFVNVNGLSLPTTSVNDPVYQFPTAFQTWVTYLPLRESVATGTYHSFNMAGNFFCWGGIGATSPNNTNHRFTGGGSGATVNAWPTTLPGVASGVIPFT